MKCDVGTYVRMNVCLLSVWYGMVWYGMAWQVCRMLGV